MKTAGIFPKLMQHIQATQPLDPLRSLRIFSDGVIEAQFDGGILDFRSPERLDGWLAAGKAEGRIQNAERKP